MNALAKFHAQRARHGEARYRVELPWIGPILGLQRTKHFVPVGGVANPGLGDALWAVFIPVIRDPLTKTFHPSDSCGRRVDVGSVLDAFWLPSGRKGRFCVEVRHDLWNGPIDGVYMLLVYVMSFAVKALPMPGRKPELPETMVAAVEKFFDEGQAQKEVGLIQLGAAYRPHDCSQITFAAASCQYPAGFVDEDVAQRSYRSLARCLDEGDPTMKPSHLLLLGDQVYVDASAGLFDPTSTYDRYQRPHERLLRMEWVRHVLRRIPACTMMDDHEIEDNWEPVRGKRKVDRSLKKGRRAYLDYQRLAGPELQKPAGDSANPLWYEFEMNGFPVFMADTRTEREPRAVETFETARIMSGTQFERLSSWLLQHKTDERPKFIASSASLLPRHRDAIRSHAGALRSDGWDGYPRSLHEFLARIAENELTDVFFLCGDEHVSFIVRAIVRNVASGRTGRIHSIHNSPLYAPFPFANTAIDNLAFEDTFAFVSSNQTYTCDVTQLFATEGDGFTLLRASFASGGSKVVHRFVCGNTGEATPPIGMP